MGMKICKDGHQEVIFEYGKIAGDDRCPQCESKKEIAIGDLHFSLLKKSILKLIEQRENETPISQGLTEKEFMEQLKEILI